MDELTLDGNLCRIFARCFDVTALADSPSGEKLLWSKDCSEGCGHSRMTAGAQGC